MKTLQEKFKKEIQLKIDKLLIKIEKLNDDTSEKSKKCFDDIWELQCLKDRI